MLREVVGEGIKGFSLDRTTVSMACVSDCDPLTHLPDESIWPDLGLCDLLAALKRLWSS